MKKTKKILAMACAMALSAAIAVGGTLAYLTSQDSVTNTFTVGKVAITLDETDTDGSKTNTTTEGRDKANAYKLYPGKSYTKDPLITVAKNGDIYKHDMDSENCWLFVKVNNGIARIEDQTNTIANQMKTNGWTLVEGTTDVYALSTTKQAGETAKVFESFKIAGTVTNEQLAEYASAKITVEAYAVQAEGFTTAQAAWTATFGAPTT